MSATNAGPGALAAPGLGQRQPLEPVFGDLSASGAEVEQPKLDFRGSEPMRQVQETRS